MLEVEERLSACLANTCMLPYIVANRPYLGGTVPIFFAKFHTVPSFLDCVPIFLNSLNFAILFPNLVILTIFIS